MPQYYVPLFIESETQVFGPLSLFQFIVVGIAGAIVIIVLTATQNLLLTFVAMIVAGMPAVFFAFGKINGEKAAKIFPLVLKFFLGEKVLLWQKRGEEGMNLKEVQRVIEEKEKIERAVTKESKLKKLNWELQLGKK